MPRNVEKNAWTAETEPQYHGGLLYTQIINFDKKQDNSLPNSIASELSFFQGNSCLVADKTTLLEPV